MNKIKSIFVVLSVLALAFVLPTINVNHAHATDHTNITNVEVTVPNGLTETYHKDGDYMEIDNVTISVTSEVDYEDLVGENILDSACAGLVEGGENHIANKIVQPLAFISHFNPESWPTDASGHKLAFEGATYLPNESDWTSATTSCANQKVTISRSSNIKIKIDHVYLLGYSSELNPGTDLSFGEANPWGEGLLKFNTFTFGVDFVIPAENEKALDDVADLKFKNYQILSGTEFSVESLETDAYKGGSTSGDILGAWVYSTPQYLGSFRVLQDNVIRIDLGTNASSLADGVHTVKIYNTRTQSYAKMQINIKGGVLSNDTSNPDNNSEKVIADTSLEYSNIALFSIMALIALAGVGLAVRKAA